MQTLAIHSMKTMHYIPQLDRKRVGYAVSSIVAIVMSTIGAVAYA